MKYAIIGAGVSGLLPAYLLKKAGHEVQVITQHEEQAALINEQGIINGENRQQVDAYTDFEQIDSDAFVIVTVNQEELQPILRLLKIRRPSNKIIFFAAGDAFFRKSHCIISSPYCCRYIRYRLHQVE
ncbi:hypothetical protein B481_2188 [Planococcus halocryophilus Or1]|uniref:ketopantoate reductase family protein n=1 Tax=Planococcus halocryophilus TaxID=1215089 RepID=UPI0002B89D1C|nr:2-dehydropantoate 2-reductase N-terminal domain-containing protein [Planococcus halocryophilus]EMF46432.1 hypothetical protein B481_2188 [Planococcus halocryophilus Or1]